MYTKINIDNIRAFIGQDWGFNLSPLTVFCGTNGSGKSTIIKALLLIKQTQTYSENKDLENGRLKFNGKYLDLGDYESFVSFGNTRNNIGITISFSDLMPVSAYNILSELKISEDVEFIEYELESKLVFCKPYDENENEAIQKKNFILRNKSRKTSGILSSANYTIRVGEEELLTWEVYKDDDNDIFPNSKYKMRLPKKYFEKIGGAKLLKLDETEGGKYVVVDTKLNGLLPEHILVNWKQRKNRAENSPQESWFPLPPAIAGSLYDLKENLDNIHHIGPLRAPGRRYYLATNDDINLDSSGEFLPYILRDKKSAKVINCHPSLDWECEDVDLAAALNYWLHFFRTGEYPDRKLRRAELSVKTKDGVLVNLQLRNQNGDSLFPIADSGFGYSQILPILVRCLLAEIDETIIIEQPELHLNPAIQVRIAEFFVAMSLSGKQIILETHSEHIVNSIRVISAEDEKGLIRKDCKIYFLETESNKPSVHELSITPDGFIPHWPKEFFGEALSLTGRLLRAQKSSKNSNKYKK